MLKNYLKIAFRNIYKNKIYSFINIIGLAIGLASCFFILLFIQNGLSFDKFNKNYNRIYRVVQESRQNGNEVVWSVTPTGFGNAFPNNFSGVKSVRLSHPMLYTPVVKYYNKLFTAKDFIFADSTFFNIFTFPLLEGNPKTALTEPFSLVISQSEAKKIFGKVDPMEKTLKVGNIFNFKITGVAKDPPPNSTIQFNFLAPFVNLKDVANKVYHTKNRDVLNNFSSSSYYTFLLLPKGFNVGAIQNKLPAFIDKYLGKGSNKELALILQPLSKIHFNTSYLWDYPNKGNIQYNYILSAIALFILLIACVNFINMSTARSATRAKEVGVRKVLGSNRHRLTWQFIMEFMLLTFVSVIIAMILTELCLPIFNSAAKVQLSFNFFSDSKIFILFLFILVLIVLMASAYPSIYLSKLQPAQVIKGFLKRGKRSNFARKALIVFQFTVSVFLIVITIIIWQQYNFLKWHKLGFNKNHIIYLSKNREINKNYEAFKTQLLQKSNIRHVSQANWIPGDAKIVEDFSWRGNKGPHSGSFFSLIVDPDFTKVLGLKFVSGRDFSWEMPSDCKDGYILNETAAKMMGWTPQEAIGKSIKSSHHNGHVIGVVKDFNFRSLRYSIEPVVMLMDSSSPYHETLIKTSSSNMANTISQIESVWKKFSPDFPFDYHFLNRSFERLYQAEQRSSEIFVAFSVLAILIACLGLFGLTSYTTQERTKEMGIRKVLGASASQIVNLVFSDFVKLVLIANIIAWPIAYYFIHKWLANFAYRINIGWWVFILSGGIALTIALITISFQAIKAATANPVKSLRYE